MTQATGLELHMLPDDQFPKLQAGLLDVLGEEGVSRLDDHLHKLARQRAGIQLPYPDWLKYLQKFEIRWVEDAAMARDEDGPSLESLRKRFQQATTEEHLLLNAISKQVFLVISEDSINSVMDASVSTIARFHDPDTAQSTKSKRRGSNGIIDPPYVLAVAADEPRELDEDEDGHGWFKPIFKVALELLATDFWHELDFQTNRNGEPLMKLNRFTKGVDSRGGALDEREGGGNAEDQDVWWGTLVPPSQRAKRRRVVQGTAYVGPLGKYKSLERKSLLFLDHCATKQPWSPGYVHDPTAWRSFRDFSPGQPTGTPLPQTVEVCTGLDPVTTSRRAPPAVADVDTAAAPFTQ